MIANTPLLTVITVAYNAVEFIERTILSVIAQKNVNIEYVVIDGGSSDGTIDMVKKYSEYIAFYVSEPDSGIYEAMNKGIAAASGKWMNFMNAGDTFFDENTVHNVLLHSGGNVGVLYGDRVIEKTDGTEAYETAKNLDEFYIAMPFGHQACFIRSDLAKARPYDLSFKLSSDYELLLNLYHNKVDFRYIKTPVCRFLSGGLSHQRRFLSRLEAVLVASRFLNDKELIKDNVFFKGLVKDYFRQNMDVCSPVISPYLGKIFSQMHEINEKYSKVVIYGYGEVGSSFFKILGDNFVVALDTNSKLIDLPHVIHPSEVIDYEYDCIVISVLGRESKITDYLVDELKIDRNKLIKFSLS